MFAVANLNNSILLIIGCRSHVTLLESFHANATLLLIYFVGIHIVIIETYFNGLFLKEKFEVFFVDTLVNSFLILDPIVHLNLDHLICLVYLLHELVVSLAL